MCSFHLQLHLICHHFFFLIFLSSVFIFSSFNLHLSFAKFIHTSFVCLFLPRVIFLIDFSSSQYFYIMKYFASSHHTCFLFSRFLSLPYILFFFIYSFISLAGISPPLPISTILFFLCTFCSSSLTLWPVLRTSLFVTPIYQSLFSLSL